MKFNALDEKMRIYETVNDRLLLPGIYCVARLDGRTFTKLTKEENDFDAPFDPKFRDIMIETVNHLMDCGFKVVYGYTQSDEISLLFDINDDTFQRKERKLVSVLSGEASAKFSIALGKIGVFDCRLCELPSVAVVVNYFRWRQEDARRNSLNAFCYWTLRKKGLSPSKANEGITGLSIADKNELLFQHDINYNDLPEWQKRGVGLYWESYKKEGMNPMTGEAATAIRKRIVINDQLPLKSEYESFIKQFL